MVMNFLRRSCRSTKNLISIFIILSYILFRPRILLRQDRYVGIMWMACMLGLNTWEALVLRSKKDIILPKDGILMITPKKYTGCRFMISTMKQNMEKLWMKLTQKGEGNIFQWMLEMENKESSANRCTKCYNKENSQNIDSIRRKPENL